MKSLAMLLLWFPLQAETVTYAKQIGPVLLERCASCHRPGEAAPFPLLTYEDARKHAAQIVRVTELRFMPPWLPIPGHGDFAGAGRLSAEQIAWFAQRFRGVAGHHGGAVDLAGEDRLGPQDPAGGLALGRADGGGFIVRLARNASLSARKVNDRNAGPQSGIARQSAPTA